jgi:hypothetical protein
MQDLRLESQEAIPESVLGRGRPSSLPMDISKAVSRVYEGMLAAVMKLTGRKNGTSNLKVRILLEDEKVMSIVVRVSEKKIK